MSWLIVIALSVLLLSVLISGYRSGNLSNITITPLYRKSSPILFRLVFTAYTAIATAAITFSLWKLLT